MTNEIKEDMKKCLNGFQENKDLNDIDNGGHGRRI
jgi:hypothetical protein